jgi:anti-sigma B factor antagonist
MVERCTLGDDLVTVLSDAHLGRLRRVLLDGGALSGEETPMQVTVQRAGVGDEVLLSGRLDGRSAGEVRDTLHAVLAAGSGRLVVDLSGIELLDATGLGVLVGAHRRAQLTGRDLVLRGAPTRVARLLRLARLDRVITLEPAAQLASA